MSELRDTTAAAPDEADLVWDFRTGQCEQQFDTHVSDVNGVRFYPAGDAVGTASDDATVRKFKL